MHPFTQRDYIQPTVREGFSQRGYIQPTVREVFKDLTDEPNDSNDFKSAAKLANHCLEKLGKGEFDLEEGCCKNKYHVMGDDPKKSS